MPCDHGVMETARVDRWLWAVRLFKTRTAASEACRGGHVRINDVRVKPSAPVKVGDTIRTRTGDRDRIVVVTTVIEHRVGAPTAQTCFEDNSPPPPPREAWLQVALRDRGSGRPSKRDRRQLEQVRQRRGGR